MSNVENNVNVVAEAMEVKTEFSPEILKEVERIGDDAEKKERFLNKAIEIQNRAWDEKYAIRKFQYSLEVLYALNASKDLLDMLVDAHAIAVNDITAGIRIKPEKKTKKAKNKKKYNLMDIQLLNMDNRNGTISMVFKTIFKNIEAVDFELSE